jgi:HEPN domain-containing protein
MTEIDVQKHIAYWRDGALKDLAFAEKSILRDREVLYGLFFAHLALEKILKAVVCKQTQEIPPRIHKLVALARLGQVDFSQEQFDFLAIINIYNLEGRYPEMEFPAPSFATAKKYLDKVKEMVEWLVKRL